MTSPHLTDPKPPIDALEALRVLVADLRALAGRLELKEHSRSLQQTLKAAQERVSGPRAVVMLLGEREDLKRRFLERLLGPNLAQVPNPTVVCTRLEYGAEPECTVTMPQGLTAVLPLDQLDAFLERHRMEKTMQTIRLPNPTLKDDLAVIDTPVVSGEAAESVLECAGQSDTWIFVLHPNHELSDASQALLRRLPEHGARLELVVEGAELLSSEERLTARERLMRTLRNCCNIEAARLTLIASAATEGDGENFWHGRFATFHSVMMQRGREHRMEATRAVVMDALREVGAEIDFELKSTGLGLRHARLRLGMKDLDGLRTRFYELGRLDGQRQPDLKAEPAPNGDTSTEKMPALAGSPTGEMAETTLPPLIAPHKEEIASVAPENTSTNAAASFVQAAPAAEPVFVSFRRPGAEAPAHGRLSVNFSEKVTRLIGYDKAGHDGKMTLPKRMAGVALAVAFVCLILWALAPRGSLFGHEAPSEWEYQSPPKQPLASNPAPAATTVPDVSPPQPGDIGSLPDPTVAETPGIPSTPLRKRTAAIRTPLLRPIPGGATAGVPHPAKRHHRRHLLGLGKLWHWVRHGHSRHTPNQ